MKLLPEILREIGAWLAYAAFLAPFVFVVTLAVNGRVA